MSQPSVAILGIRGIPAAYGGFETFAERLALFLVRRGWRVTVYCQTEAVPAARVDEWNGIRRIHIQAKDNVGGSVSFDWKAISDLIGRKAEVDVALTLGYNTAAFCARLRMAGIPNLINMDGIEWSRSKWGRPARAWLWLNDWIGCWIANHLVADHPLIAEHLQSRTSRRRMIMIPYGADAVPADEPSDALAALGLEPGRFATVIARSERENSVLEIVHAFSRRPRGVKLAVLGRYAPTDVPYHAEVMAAASSEVTFLGAIHDAALVRSLRAHSLFYAHGHQVGGTNPSLLEALAAGNPVVAHDNRFNRWVAAEAGVYFSTADECATLIDNLLDDAALRARMSGAARARHAAAFRWETSLSTYEAVLREHLPLARRIDSRLSSIAS